MSCRLLFPLFLFLILTACGGSDSSPTQSPSPADGNDLAGGQPPESLGDSGDSPGGQPAGGSDDSGTSPGGPPPESPGDSGDLSGGQPAGDSGDGGDLAGGQPAEGPAGLSLAKRVGDLRTPRDLIFGPFGSSLVDELFVVHFEGFEATWVRSFETSSQSLQPIQNSLVGAIAVDIDADARFFFACLTPVMGASVGVVTVRRFDSSVDDFQYRGVDGPIGLALDSQGGLFVANRDSRSVVRIDFADGAPPDGHGFELIAPDLQFAEGELPAHLLVDPDDRLFICETDAHQIRTWSAEDGLQTFATADQGLARPVGIARLPGGSLLVTNHGDGSIVELNADGSLMRRIDTGLGAGVLYGIAARGDGRIYVVSDRDGSGSLYQVDL